MHYEPNIFPIWRENRGRGWGENLKLKAISKIDTFTFINNRSGVGSIWKAKAHIAWHSPVRKAAAASSLGIGPIKEQNEKMIVQSDSELSGVSVVQSNCGW